MSAPPYQKFFWGSYHKHTAHLRHAREHGAYLLLLGALWNNAGRLPADDDTLASYAQVTPKEWSSIKPKLLPLFRVVRGKLTQPRVTEDLAKYESTSCKRKEAGKRGGSASAGKDRENRQAIASVLPTKPEPESEREDTKPSVPAPAEPIAPPDPAKEAWDRAVKLVQSRGRTSEGSARSFFGKLLSANGIEARDLLPSIVKAETTGTADPQAYLRRAAEAVASRRGLFETPEGRVANWDADTWRAAVRAFRESGRWSDAMGPQPDRPGCPAPPGVLAEMGYSQGQAA